MRKKKCFLQKKCIDYYPFGMPMPNRQIVNGERYRYAFQGQEKDPETGKEAFQLRLWDGRIGRWLSPDPYRQFSSPYLGLGNNPITGKDKDGGIVIFPDIVSANRAMRNLNALFRKEFGFTMDVISVKKYSYKIHKGRGDKGFALDFNSSEKFATMLFDLGLTCDKELIVKAFKDLVNDPNVEITGELAPSTDPSASSSGGLWKAFKRDLGFAVSELNESDRVTLKQSGGGTYNSSYFKVNKDLPDYMDDPTNFNIGSTILHETLWHLSPMGPFWLKNLGDSNRLFRAIGVPAGGSAHKNGNYRNKRLEGYEGF